MEPELSNTTAISRLLTSRVPPAAHAPCITHGSSIKAASRLHNKRLNLPLPFSSSTVISSYRTNVLSFM
jgi:hypothetical protein